MDLGPRRQMPVGWLVFFAPEALMRELPAPVQSSSYGDDEPFKVIFLEL